MVFISIICGVLPLLELLNLLAKPASLRPRKVQQAPLKAAAGDASATSTATDKPRNRLWSVWHYFNEHMSKTAALSLTVFCLWNIISFIIALRRYYQDSFD
jgi:hypothetical protein